VGLFEQGLEHVQESPVARGFPLDEARGRQPRGRGLEKAAPQPERPGPTHGSAPTASGRARGI
jgi:hypothetical protein